MKRRRVLVLPDTQIFWNKDTRKIDGIDLQTWYAVLNYIETQNYDEVVQLGDFLDFNCISSHNKENLRAIEGQRILKDYTSGNTILDELQLAVKGAAITILEGNHEYRMERLIDKMPALEGWVEVEKGLRLEERGINYVKTWEKGEVYRIGKAGFVHGLATTNFHSKAMALKYGMCIFYGHTHDVQEYSLEMKGDNSTIVGASLGCLCRYDLPYMRGRPSKWQQAFAEFYFKENGYFNHFITRIFGHSFTATNGKTYAP